MKKLRFVIVLMLVCIHYNFGQTGAYEKETKAEKAARMQWYTDARFGMFIHWGAYSVLDGEYKGKKQKGALGEWIMFNLKIPVKDYKKDVVGNFNPTEFDADTWVKYAHDTGMKYIVMTTKHHDGFALFQSETSDYNIVAQTPFKRDVIKELSDACKKYGLKFGVYYSQAQDWYHPGGFTPKKRWDNQQEGDYDTYFKTIVKGHVTELFSNYGEISLIWWDSARKVQNKELANEIGRELVKLQPNIIVNPRLSPTSQKDFQTFEQVIPGILTEDYNELCLTQNRSWSYKPSDTNWKEPAFLLKTLTHMVSIGGNFLFNVGPKPDGTFPQQAIEALQYIGDWMEVHNEAIYQTKASPFYKLPFGEAALKSENGQHSIYLFVYEWPKDGTLDVLGIKNNIASVSILGQKNTISVTNTANGIRISDLPKKAPHEAVSVIKIQISESLQIDEGYVKPNLDNTIQLTPLNALLTIKPQYDCIPFVAYHNDEPYFANWKNCIPTTKKNTGNKAHWKIEVAKKGRYKVNLRYATKVAGNIITLKNKQRLHVKLPNTNGLTNFQSFELGEIELTKGINTLTLTGGKKNELWDEIQIQSLELIKL
ncbi:alpha-L-fucosidase [Kordia periserrulae]|uniref:alpha-L-fucosidase n=1 Tax=Kordia periserrulae TaxID=701523 RepID=A0A2T6C1Z8_9FLAO|nr:alpha-L-fucosidase [Kordia periserrulae]PTX62335.1 alpha-L-fucosidase [Kordia periserrulae]